MNRVKALRIALKLSQYELAKLANTSQPQIHRIERGEREPLVSLGVRIAKALGRTVEYVFP